MWSEDHDDFIEINQTEFNNETSENGFSLINNSIVVTIDGDDILYDVHFGNVHGLEIEKLNLLSKRLEE